MFDEYSDGYCPQCSLENRRVIMKLNDSDLWECPDCHLQAHSRSKGMFAIMRQRGNSVQFRDAEATAFVIGWVLSPAAAETPFKPKGGFSSEAELRTFLSTIT
jgi:Zn ribbon nucleic-acid-binding protein